MHARLDELLSLRDGEPVDARVKTSRIEAHDVRGIPLVQAKQPDLAKLPRGVEDHCFTSPLKRLSSVSRYPV